MNNEVHVSPIHVHCVACGYHMQTWTDGDLRHPAFHCAHYRPLVTTQQMCDNCFKMHDIRLELETSSGDYTLIATTDVELRSSE